MADQIAKNQSSAVGNGGARQPVKPPGKQTQDVGQDAAKDVQDMAGEAREAGRDLKDRVAGLTKSTADAARAKAEELAHVARGYAAEAGEAIKERVEGQKEAGANYLSNIADTIRRASHEFDDDMPIAGTYMRKAASRVEEFSDTVQHGDLSDLARGLQDFARRQPTAFLGLAVLAGFGAVRFLKSSASDGDPSHSIPSRSTARTGHDDNKGYRDDFAK